MAGDEDKKKKKKSKKSDKPEKAEEAPAPPAPEPEPEPPVQEAAVDEAPAPAEGEAPAEAPVEGELAEGEVPAEGEVVEQPPPPKKKPKFFVHWNRRKPRFYDYNFDYGENYYSSMVKYMDTKSDGVPRRMAFAERGMISSLTRKNVPDTRTANLLFEVRSSIRSLESSQKTYMWEHRK